MSEKRKVITLKITVSCAPHVTKAMAKQEVRSRVNYLSGHSWEVDEKDVRVRKVSNDH